MRADMGVGEVVIIRCGEEMVGGESGGNMETGKGFVGWSFRW